MTDLRSCQNYSVRNDAFFKIPCGTFMLNSLITAKEFRFKKAIEFATSFSTTNFQTSAGPKLVGMFLYNASVVID